MYLKNTITEIFRKGLEAVLPNCLVHRLLKAENSKLFIGRQQYILRENVYVVGFGKAVLGMAKALEEILNGHIQCGVLSIPFDLQHSLSASPFDKAKGMLLSQDSRISVKEGARNNLPDCSALNTALEIEKLVASLNKEDLLFVLVSGGGSALLPSPIEQISLSDKLKTIKILSESGSTIQELNVIRKHLSRMKGGKLAEMNKSCSMVSLILSDIVGDPLDLIASGPTIPDFSTFTECLQIFKQHLVMEKIPSKVLQYIEMNAKDENQSKQSMKPETVDSFPNVHNIIVGNNIIAVDECKKAAKNQGFPTIILTTSLTGDVNHVASSFASLLFLLIHNQKLTNDSCFEEELLDEVHDSLRVHNKICIISAGETTVKVTGNGVGGRNQELALRTAVSFHSLEIEGCNSNPTNNGTSFCFLSAGTDGQDGPTDAAGAFSTRDMIYKAELQGLQAEKFLANNDSYGFFTKFNKGKNLFKTGLTGTNVMDIQILIVEKREI